MVYVALLRGINVGGNNRVEMARLKQIFERLGFASVRTYINSGNVVFESNDRSVDVLDTVIETAVEQEFGFYVPVVIRDTDNIHRIVRAVSDAWVNDATMKTDVMFLWQRYDSPNTLDELNIKPEIEDVLYVPGALVWRVDRHNVTKSGMLKLVGTPLYKHMTIRNINTVRKLAQLMPKQ